MQEPIGFFFMDSSPLCVYDNLGYLVLFQSSTKESKILP